MPSSWKVPKPPLVFINGLGWLDAIFFNSSNRVFQDMLIKVLFLRQKQPGLCIGILLMWAASGSFVAAMALPPPEDIPEEVLRTEIITEARSPIDGEKLTAAEYAELEETLQARDWAPEMDSAVRQVIFLLQIRRAIRTFTPFL